MHRFVGTRFIIFDLDGTLIDGYEAITESLNAALEHLGQEKVPAAKVRYLVGRGLEELLRQFVSEEQLPEAVRVFRERFEQVCLSGSYLLEGVGPVLARLRKGGLRLAVASNKPGERVRDICAHLEIDRHFEVMMGAMDVAELKPHPMMVETVMSRMGATPENTLYVGDMHVDVQTARAAGVRVICVLTGSSTHEQLAEAKPDAIVRTLEDVVKLVGLA